MNRILVTGGKGFLGSYVVRLLKAKGYKNVFSFSSQQYDLVNMADILKLFREFCPDIVLHLAARVGGIGINQKNPASFFYDNLMMGIQLMEVARQQGVQKFVTVGTVCTYPEHTPVPFKESNLWNSYPEKTNAPYGLAKKMLLVQGQAYHQQYGFNAIYLIPPNLYGPGDNFNPKSSHVAAALIKRCIEAVEFNQTELEVWGTGRANREFLYIEDAAQAIVMAMENYDQPEPMNIGSGIEVSIRDLIHLIAELTGFTGKIVWNTSKPDGQQRRCLDISKAKQLLGFEAKTNLKQGLQQTIDWYKNLMPIDGGDKRRFGTLDVEQ